MLKTCLFLFLGIFLFAGIVGAADVEDHIMSGSKFAQEKKYQEATREYETAVNLDPKNADANLLLGLTLANTGDLDRATKYSTIAVQIKPSYAGYNNLGLIYANQSKYDEAIDAFKNAIKINPKSYQAWYQLGQVYAQALNFDKALEAYNKVIEFNPKLPSAYQGLGSSYFWSGNTAAAYEQVAKLKALKMNGKAQELEAWLKDKEAKKKKSAH